MMGILTVICTFSILISLLISMAFTVGVKSTRALRLIVLITIIPTLFGAMLLVTTMGEIEKLQKERVEKYEQITYTVYKKK